MAKLTIEIELDNAAFEDCAAEEAARILREQVVNPLIITGVAEPILYDWNGNRVGKATVTET